ncbi:hypothetical protein P3T76_009414 [Phytophthora citrophthora]|uniref:DDE-1 domain-containing protein n=1 Tax=Phytophthora citrophthora TaxID=4793 RepID=A0AAD9GGU8_9STRA|nr:hypothetical protein P3T76_009414 [Phytophthora citrophthora]
MEGDAEDVNLEESRQEGPGTSPAVSASIVRRKHYSIHTKHAVILGTEGMSVRAAAKAFGVLRRTLTDWVAEKENHFAFQGSENTPARTPWRTESIPFSPELLTYMKDQRRADQALTTTRMVQFIRSSYLQWLTEYTENKKDTSTAYDSLFRLLRRFAYRHGFTQRTPHGLKENREDLVVMQRVFSMSFQNKYGHMPSDKIINIDETGVYNDTPPSRIICSRGEPSNITTTQKHSARMTVVCSIRGDVRGEPDGVIANEEVPSYPKGHHYAVQPKAGMDGRVWHAFLRTVMLPCIEGPFVLLIDNFATYQRRRRKL